MHKLRVDQLSKDFFFPSESKRFHLPLEYGNWVMGEKSVRDVTRFFFPADPTIYIKTFLSVFPAFDLIRSV